MVLVVEPLLHWVALADHCTSASSPLLIVAASNATAIEFGIVVVTPITVTLSLPIVNANFFHYLHLYPSLGRLVSLHFK
jgi:hypothetical protein